MTDETPTADDELTTDEKLHEINRLAEASLKMRSPGDWYVNQNSVEVRTDGTGSCHYGNGRTANEAVEDHWWRLTAPDSEIMITRTRGGLYVVRDQAAGRWLFSSTKIYAQAATDDRPLMLVDLPEESEES